MKHTNGARVHGRYGLRDDTAERVPSANDFVEGHVAEAAFTEHLCKAVGDLDLDRCLHSQKVRLGGFADTKAVVEEGRVVVLSSDVDIAVPWSEVLGIVQVSECLMILP